MSLANIVFVGNAPEEKRDENKTLIGYSGDFYGINGFDPSVADIHESSTDYLAKVAAINYFTSHVIRDHDQTIPLLERLVQDGKPIFLYSRIDPPTTEVTRGHMLDIADYANTNDLIHQINSMDTLNQNQEKEYLDSPLLEDLMLEGHEYKTGVTKENFVPLVKDYIARHPNYTEIIVKPGNGMGGRGVEYFSVDDPDLEQKLKNYDYLGGNLMFQKKMDKLSSDVRVIVMKTGKDTDANYGYEAVSFIQRNAADGDFRSNISQGGSMGTLRYLSPIQQEVVERVAPFLYENNLGIVGLDIPADPSIDIAYLIENNMMSPGAVSKGDYLHGIEGINKGDRAQRGFLQLLYTTLGMDMPEDFNRVRLVDQAPDLFLKSQTHLYNIYKNNQQPLNTSQNYSHVS